MTMTNLEIEQLAELIAIKTAEATKKCVLEIANRMMDDKVLLHAAQCEAKSYSTVKTFSIAAMGGVIATAAKWLIGKI